MKAPHSFGQHYLIDFRNCDAATLEVAERTMDILLRAARKSRATVVDHLCHQYEPYGVSGVVLIAESHFGIHTWPEFRFATVDIFTCGEEMDAAVAIDSLQQDLGAEHVEVKVVSRGQLSVSSKDSIATS